MGNSNLSKTLGRPREQALKGRARREGVGQTHLHPGPGTSLRVRVGKFPVRWRVLREHSKLMVV